MGCHNVKAVFFGRVFYSIVKDEYANEGELNYPLYTPAAKQSLNQGKMGGLGELRRLLKMELRFFFFV